MYTVNRNPVRDLPEKDNHLLPWGMGSFVAIKRSYLVLPSGPTQQIRGRELTICSEKLLIFFFFLRLPVWGEVPEFIKG